MHLNKVVSPILVSKADINGWEMSSANSFNSLTFKNEKHLLLKRKEKNPSLLTFVRHYQI